MTITTRVLTAAALLSLLGGCDGQATKADDHSGHDHKAGEHQDHDDHNPDGATTDQNAHHEGDGHADH